MSVFNVAVQIGDADLCFLLGWVVHFALEFIFLHNRRCYFRPTLPTTPGLQIFATIESVNFYFFTFLFEFTHEEKEK